MPNYKAKQVALEDLGSAAHIYRSSSSSRAGMYHYTFVWGDNRGVTCSCEGYVHHGHCKHVDNVPIDTSLPVDLLADTDGLSDEEAFEGLSDDHST